MENTISTIAQASQAGDAIPAGSSRDVVSCPVITPPSAPQDASASPLATLPKPAAATTIGISKAITSSASSSKPEGANGGEYPAPEHQAINGVTTTPPTPPDSKSTSASVASELQALSTAKGQPPTHPTPPLSTPSTSTPQTVTATLPKPTTPTAEPCERPHFKNTEASSSEAASASTFPQNSNTASLRGLTRSVIPRAVKGGCSPLDPSPHPPRSPRRQRMRIISRSVRFTAQEWANISDKLVGRKFSDVARALFLGAELPEPSTARGTRSELTEFESRKIQQLGWFGNNFNQVARAVNIGTLNGLNTIAALVSLERAISEAAS